MVIPSDKRVRGVLKEIINERNNILAALNEALQEEMERDKTVFVMGEDVGIYGGAYGVTRGLYENMSRENKRFSYI